MTITYLNIDCCYSNFSIISLYSIATLFFVQVVFAILLRFCNLLLIRCLTLYIECKAFNTYLNLFVYLIVNKETIFVNNKIRDQIKLLIT